MGTSKIRWLDRTLVVKNVPWTLCTSQAEFDTACDWLGYERSDWLDPVQGGAVYKMQGATVVCVRLNLSAARTQYLCSHEAVHIAERQFEDMGEDKPSEEF